MPGEEEFYDLAPPDFFQQGDILVDVPMLSLPQEADLLVLRDSLDHSRPQRLQPGMMAVLLETEVGAFAENEYEYIVATAIRGPAVLITQTCNLDREDEWLVAPIYPVEGHNVDLNNLMAGKIENAFGLPSHPNGLFPSSFVTLSDLKPIRKNSVELDDRVASLLPGTQLRLADKITRALAREWGFAANEKIPKTGKYRCLRCNRWENLENPVRDFVEGELFLDCDNCRKMKKAAQWYQLLKQPKS